MSGIEMKPRHTERGLALGLAGGGRGEVRVVSVSSDLDRGGVLRVKRVTVSGGVRVIGVTVSGGVRVSAGGGQGGAGGVEVDNRANTRSRLDTMSRSDY